MAVFLHGGADDAKVWGDQAPTDEEKLGCIPVTQAPVSWDSLGRTLPSSLFLTWHLELHPESLGLCRKGGFANSERAHPPRV